MTNLKLNHQVVSTIHQVAPVILVQHCTWLAINYNRVQPVLYRVLLITVAVLLFNIIVIRAQTSLDKVFVWPDAVPDTKQRITN